MKQTDNLSERLTYRMSPEDRERIEKEAERLGMSASEYTRACVLDVLSRDDNPVDTNSDSSIDPFDPLDYKTQQRGNMDEFGETLSDSTMWPIPVRIYDWDTTTASPAQRIPLIRGMLESKTERNADIIGEVRNADTVVRRILSDDFGMSRRGTQRYITRIIDERAAFPTPGADPKFDTDDLYSELVDMRYRIGPMMKVDVLEKFESVESFFDEFEGVPVVSSDGFWYTDQSERDGRMRDVVMRLRAVRDAADDDNRFTREKCELLLERLREWADLRGIDIE
jgi:hypothetical protein